MKKIIFTENAPAPIGPYNQAILKGNTLYTSGQIAIHPKTGELVTENIEDLKAQIAALVPFYKSGEILGIHLEGPYLSHARCGAHEPSLLINPDVAEIKELIEVGAGAISMITIAPELPGAIEAIKYLSAAGIKVAIGHTDGNFTDAAAGTNAGASIVTHFMNAMSKEKIEGSISSFVLVDERLSVELILDGHHVPFNTASEIVQAIGDRIVLVTDAMAAAGSVDGNYTIGSLEVAVVNGVARLTSNHSLAGSTLTMDKAFVNFLNINNNIVDCVFAASTLPAKTLGLHAVGELAIGKKSHILEYHDSSISVISS